MNQVIGNSYANAYVFCEFVAGLGLLLRFSRRLTEGKRILSIALLLPLVTMYFVGMHRIAGGDYESYYRAYYQLDDLIIPDPGYTLLGLGARELGLSFSQFLFLIGVFTVWVMGKVAPRVPADPWVVVGVYLMHLAIGRELSQMRIGFAVAIYLLGQIQPSRWTKLLLYVLAASVHITVVILIVIWSYANWTRHLTGSKRWASIYLPLGAFAVLGSSLLQVAALVDPRVEIYMSWDDETFGAPLTSYSTLARTVAVLAIYIAASRRFRRFNPQAWITVELAGAAVLFGFAQFSIFASRLSNVAVSMYPFGLGVIALVCRTETTQRKSLFSDLTLKVSTLAMLAVLLIRPGSYEALAQVVPTIYKSAQDAP